MVLGDGHYEHLDVTPILPLTLTPLLAPALALPELQSGRLVAPFPVLSDCGVAYHAVSATRRPSIELFVQWLVAEAESTTRALEPFTHASA